LIFYCIFDQINAALVSIKLTLIQQAKRVAVFIHLC